ncbi:MAG: hypothetical protein NW206_19605 [Hyphomonadaceae bacterium]|nr:hypothetical protein [Hyphomonadaceae bacterium]
MQHSELYEAAQQLRQANEAGGAAPLYQWAEKWGEPLLLHAFEDDHLNGWARDICAISAAIKDNNPMMVGQLVANLRQSILATQQNRNAARRAMDMQRKIENAERSS